MLANFARQSREINRNEQGGKRVSAGSASGAPGAHPWIGAWIFSVRDPDAIRQDTRGRSSYILAKRRAKRRRRWPTSPPSRYHRATRFTLINQPVAGASSPRPRPATRFSLSPTPTSLSLSLRRRSLF